MATEKKEGTVKWFNANKGYGFITPRDEGKDLFVHFKDLQVSGFKTVKEGQRVRYVPKDGAKGPQATEVEIID